MKQNPNKLTKYYTKALLDAYNAGAREQWELLRERPEINWTYCHLGDHIINSCTLAGDAKSLLKILEQNESLPEGEFLQSICNAASSGIECVKILVENIDKFGGKDEDYIYNITSGLRWAAETNEFDTFDYLLSLGAVPNDWWVVYHTSKKSNKEMYKKLMIDTLKLKKLPNRKFVQSVCMREGHDWKPIDISLLVE